MKTSDFNFLLPEELIAQYPLENRTGSRLLHLQQERITHHLFSDLPDLLTAGDVLIFNNTRVIPARLFARKETGGKIEILIERILSEHCAIAHVKANKPLRLPCTVRLENAATVTISDRLEGLFKLTFHTAQSIAEILTDIGNVPLPKYMQRAANVLDQERYQTIYATQEGAVAAPTAGLHFDHGLLKAIKAKGIDYGFITLHIGAGTFKPVSAEYIIDHQIHHEVFTISSSVCDLINSCKKRGGRVIAVGTTSVRALESAMSDQAELLPTDGETNIFIYPGYRFRWVDGLITNFHLPRSTLLMLVCALGGYHPVTTAYRAAINERYRFYSYGDAMFLSLYHPYRTA